MSWIKYTTTNHLTSKWKRSPINMYILDKINTPLIDRNLWFFQLETRSSSIVVKYYKVGQCFLWQFRIAYIFNACLSSISTFIGYRNWNLSNSSVIFLLWCAWRFEHLHRDAIGWVEIVQIKINHIPVNAFSLILYSTVLAYCRYVCKFYSFKVWNIDLLCYRAILIRRKWLEWESLINLYNVK